MPPLNFNKFDVEILDKLIEDDSSCVKVRRRRIHLALQPYQLHDINNSIENILNKGITKYHPELDGILFGYKNVNLISEMGSTFNDTCFIHVDVEADFFVFKPEQGKILQGIINKTSQDHIGCLVHGLFNISLPKPEHENDWLGRSLSIGNKVCLEVIHTNFNLRLPYIRGKIKQLVN